MSMFVYVSQASPGFQCTKKLNNWNSEKIYSFAVVCWQFVAVCQWLVVVCWWFVVVAYFSNYGLTIISSPVFMKQTYYHQQSAVRSTSFMILGVFLNSFEWSLPENTTDFVCISLQFKLHTSRINVFFFPNELHESPIFDNISYRY